MSILDGGDFHFHIGKNRNAGIHINHTSGLNEEAVRIETHAGIDGYTALGLKVDTDGSNAVSAIKVDFDATSFAASGDLATIINVAINNTGATLGDIHVLDVAVANPTGLIEVEAVATHEGVDPIAQYLGDPAVLAAAFTHDGAYVDVTSEFSSAGSNVEIFSSSSDYIYIAAAAKWDEINVALSTNSSHSITPAFEYVTDAGSWVAFTPSDDTSGFTSPGTIRFSSENLTTWGVRTINEVTGEAGADDYYWIRIQRTRAVLPTSPIESTIQVTTIGSKYKWGSHGDLEVKTLAITDGITAPGAVVGFAKIYVDSADGDLKIRFSDGTIKTIMTDT